MTELNRLTDPAAWPSLADALRRWLPRQRWFAGKDRTIVSAEVVDTFALSGPTAIVDVIVEVAYREGGTEWYQVPLTAVSRGSRPDDEVTRVDDHPVVDAVGVDEAVRTLASQAVDTAPQPTVQGAAVVGRLPEHSADEWPALGTGPGAAGVGPDLPEPRPLAAEQSNTSVVFGEALILKLFRRLEAGTNPDVEVTRSLTEQGFPHVPAQRASLELCPGEARGQQPGGTSDDGDAEGGTTALAVLSDFVPGGEQGWALATEEVAGLAREGPSEPDGPLQGAFGDLGDVIARLHTALANAFDTREADSADVVAWSREMTAQAERVLDAAARHAPVAAGPVLDRRSDLLTRLERLASQAQGGRLLRIHGDLHLGQVLRDRQGVWQILDFEGEPARSLAHRRALNSPLRDVAGMLRSIDYAAATGAMSAEGELPPAVARWRDDARATFLQSYLDVATREGLVARQPEVRDGQLAAFELDKAVYELGYELANRPAWLHIPLNGIMRVLADGEPGTRTENEQDDSLESPVTRRGTPADSDPPSKTSGDARPTEGWQAPAEQVRSLVNGEHTDPHQVLGAHQLEQGGAVVRAFRPEAEHLDIVLHGESVPAVRTDDGGLFEAPLDVVPSPGDYRLRVRYPDGGTYELRDPYAFWPTLGAVDLHLAGEGRHEELWRRMGAHVHEVDGVMGTSFAVWAPNARGVRVVGDFNSWDGRLNPMRLLGESGIWELFLPDVSSGSRYKYELVTADGSLQTRADPYAFATDSPPGTSSRVYASTYEWGDAAWMTQRGTRGRPTESPLSLYEVHLGSWRQAEGELLDYRELGVQLADYLERMGFTHVELLPPAEHPLAASWGYQVTGYFAPTARHGDPDDFRFLVDYLHQRGIGVIVDWVPAHFPKDSWALARFDGTALYEHADPRRGEQPDWGTLVFNFGRHEVRNFLIANALYWLEELHVDGLRIDAVASMLYLDYSREDAEWVPNVFGGRENLEAVDFMKELNRTVYGRNPHALMIAEESTAWPGVTRPVHLGGLGYGFKWNMGWMHDTLTYFTKEPIHRRYHHQQLTFGLLYAFSENFVLPISHDEVVHGKRSLLGKMPGDRWQQFANLRALYGYMWAHPGKQLLFMGCELGQWREWSEERELDWDVLAEDDHAGLQRLVADLNRVYQNQPALWELDTDPEGFSWIDANNSDENMLSFVRYGQEGQTLVCIANFSPVPRPARVGMPTAGDYHEVVNTDAGLYGGSDVGNLGTVHADTEAWHGMPACADLTVPPLGVLWLVPA